VQAQPITSHTTVFIAHWFIYGLATCCRCAATRVLLVERSAVPRHAAALQSGRLSQTLTSTEGCPLVNGGNVWTIHAVQLRKAGTGAPSSCALLRLRLRRQPAEQCRSATAAAATIGPVPSPAATRHSATTSDAVRPAYRSFHPPSKHLPFSITIPAPWTEPTTWPQPAPAICSAYSRLLVRYASTPSVHNLPAQLTNQPVTSITGLTQRKGMHHPHPCTNCLPS
jgi:hypothetical protein